MTCPPVPGRDDPEGCAPGSLDALDAADTAFHLLCQGPQPLAVHASALAPGLPGRPVPVTELRALLLHPATPAAARNAVWAELVRRARTGQPAWVLALPGIALPGLRRAAASLSAVYRGDPGDLQAEILTGFLAAMRALDLDDLDSVPLASRLCWAAWRAGQALVYADADYASRRRELGDSGEGPALPWGHPDFVLAAAVRRGILTAGQAELIGRNRLEGIPLSQIAAETGMSRVSALNRGAGTGVRSRFGARSCWTFTFSDGCLSNPVALRYRRRHPGGRMLMGDSCRGSPWPNARFEISRTHLSVSVIPAIHPGRSCFCRQYACCGIRETGKRSLCHSRFFQET
jgi:hypothetical protein